MKPGLFIIKSLFTSYIQYPMPHYKEVKQWLTYNVLSKYDSEKQILKKVITGEGQEEEWLQIKNI
ncbi:MAG: hypothetical protein M3040_08775 [Bacteroidota bacterium]|nr:hypothetical protein [Bacteroidota bacterium]